MQLDSYNLLWALCCNHLRRKASYMLLNHDAIKPEA